MHIREQLCGMTPPNSADLPDPVRVRKFLPALHVLLVVIAFAELGICGGDTLIFGATPAAAATLRVPTSEYPDIATALSAAASGDSVLVAPGTYTGPNNRNLSFDSKELVIRSEMGPEVTILDIQGSASDPGRGFLIDGGQTNATVLDGFTIINGWMSTQESLVGAATPGALHNLSAGGLQITLLSSPIIRNMIIRQCHSEFTGGGISVEVRSAPTIQDCIIKNCSAGLQGGGMSIETGSTGIVERCVVTGNRAPDAGGIACHSEPFNEDRLVIRSCTISGNRADRGGGIMCMVGTKTTFEQVLVWGNCGDGSEDILIEFSAAADFSCSFLDTSKVVIDSGTEVSFGEDSILQGSPQFCEPEDCPGAPNDRGDYGLMETSPCLASSSPCGLRIGALGLGVCGLPPATIESSWGSIKARFGAESNDPGEPDESLTRPESSN